MAVNKIAMTEDTLAKCRYQNGVGRNTATINQLRVVSNDCRLFRREKSRSKKLKVKSLNK